MSWIESHQSLATHRKLFQFAKLLHINRPQAIGHLHLLWWWCLDNAPDGNLSKVPDEVLSAVCEWHGDPSKLRSSLFSAGFIDPPGNLHDWYDYAGKLVQRRQIDRERHRKSNGTPSELHRNSVGTPSLPYPTVPYSTVPKKEEEKEETATVEKAVKDSKKATTEADFLEYVAETKAEFPDLDCEVEFKRFTLYWSEGRKKLQRPKTAWHNWLEKAREFKSRNGTSQPQGKKWRVVN